MTSVCLRRFLPSAATQCLHCMHMGQELNAPAMPAGGSCSTQVTSCANTDRNWASKLHLSWSTSSPTSAHPMENRVGGVKSQSDVWGEMDNVKSQPRFQGILTNEHRISIRGVIVALKSRLHYLKCMQTG